MSKFVATKVGVFRHWRANDGTQGFLFLCPACEEWLPLNDAIMGGEIPIDHEFKKQAVFCSFSGFHPELGPTLVASAQAWVLVDGRAWMDSEREAIAEWREMAGLESRHP